MAQTLKKYSDNSINKKYFQGILFVNNLKTGRYLGEDDIIGLDNDYQQQ